MVTDSKITVAGLSRQIGCSNATVSRVLNNSGPVSTKLREAILEAARVANYVLPSERGGRRRCVSSKTGTSCRTVEIIQYRPPSMVSPPSNGSPSTVNPNVASEMQPWSGFASTSAGRVMEGAVEELMHWGYRAQIRAEANLFSPAMVADLNRPNRCGVILVGEGGPDHSAFMRRCSHPVVCVELDDVHDSDVVMVDHCAGLTDAFDHLFDFGHRRIGFVGRHDRGEACVARFNTYQSRMAEAGLPIREDWISRGSDQIETTAAAIHSLLNRRDRPSALLCASDLQAMGVVRAASRLGLAIPGDLSVIGFGDAEWAAMVTPSLSTVRVPSHDMGRQAVRHLVWQIQQPRSTASQGCRLCLRPKLIVRSSTAAAAYDDDAADTSCPMQFETAASSFDSG